MKSSFPRGLVLGLTMAEVVLLIIFVLLLALAAMLHRETEGRRAAEEEAEQANEEVVLFELQAREWEAFLEEWELADAWAEAAPAAGEREAARSRRAEVERQAGYWMELVQELGGPESVPPEEFISALTDAAKRDEEYRSSGATPEAVAAAAAIESQAKEAGLDPEDLVDAARAVAEAAAASGMDLSPETLVEAARIAEAAREALRARGEEATPEAVAALVRDAERWRERAGQSLTELAANLERAEEQVERLRAQSRSRSRSRSGAGRGGTDHPSCVYRDGDRPAYLFEVGLVESGYLLRPAEIALDPPANLRPLRPAAIRPDRALGETEFEERTQEIFDWSRREQCRFFVRVFDHTAPDRKARYKELMQTLEGRFYKYEGTTGESPFTRPATGPEPPGGGNGRRR